MTLTHQENEKFVLINNKTEWLDFVQKITNKYFSSWKSPVEEYFGFNLKCDDDGNYLEEIRDYQGEMEVEPERFPAIVYFCFEGDTSIRYRSALRIVDWCYLDEIGLKESKVI